MENLLIAPSLLSADFTGLKPQLQALNEAGADLLHFDVMDGKFVPEISFGEPVLRSIKKDLAMPVDVHLMIEDPLENIESFAAAGADFITVHLEACPDARRVLQKIRALGLKAGLAIRPDMPVERVFPYLDLTDMVLVMTVYPGFGGQAFLPSSPERIARVKEQIGREGRDILIEVDGGINMNTLKTCRDAGASVFVAGSAVFKGDIRKNILDFRNILQS